MNIVQYLIEHHNHTFYLIAGISFIVELSLLGFGGPLLFFAIASVLTGLLIDFSVISGWESEILTVGLLSCAIALILWKPLKTFQNAGGGADTSSDMIGRQVTTSEIVTINCGSIRFSGINWHARIASECGTDSIPEGVTCVIAAVDGNVMIVKPL